MKVWHESQVPIQKIAGDPKVRRREWGSDAEAATDGETTNIAAQDISWTATDLAGKFFSSDTIRIRKGDSLLLTAAGTGTTLAMDAHGDGVYEFSGMPGDKFPALFDTPGTYAAKAKMDGVEIGSLMIHVLDADIHKPIACEVGFQREKNVVIAPITQRTSVVFTTNDSYLMDVSEKGAFNNSDGQGTTIYLKAKKRGTPILLARLPGANGPLVAYREVDEFTLDIPALEHVVIDSSAQAGSSKLIMRPYVAEVRFSLDMFAHSSTFAGGVTNLSVNSTSFMQVFDTDTNEIIGEYIYDIEMPNGEDMYCFSIQPHQSASAEVSVGESHGINGHNCIVSVEQIEMWANSKMELPIKLIQKGNPPKQHKVTIVKGPKNNSRKKTDEQNDPVFDSSGKSAWDKRFDCGVEGIQSPVVRSQAQTGIYNVDIEGTVFLDRIIVTDKDFILNFRAWGNLTQAARTVNDIGYETERRAVYVNKVKTDKLGVLPGDEIEGYFNGEESKGTARGPLAREVLKWRRDVTCRRYLWRPSDKSPREIWQSFTKHFTDDGGGQTSNDGPSSTDDSITDTNGDIFCSDAPSMTIFNQLDKIDENDETLFLTNAKNGSVAAMRFSAREWVLRNDGSLASRVMTWHSYITIKKIDGKWVRAGLNEIQTGPGSTDFTGAEAEAIK